jgi:hypothetical protein
VGQQTLFPIPRPHEAGVTCRACGGVGGVTRHCEIDGKRLIRLDCSACGRFVRHLDPDGALLMPADPGVPAPAKRPPGSGCKWLGMVRAADGVWLAVALAADLGRCWDALLTCSLEGDRLAMPVKGD